MAIGNYTDLQTSVASFIDRDDLDVSIPDLIALAEARINTISRLNAQEDSEQITLNAGSSLADLPARFLELLAASYDDTKETLRPASRLFVPTGTGRPSKCAITSGSAGEGLRFDLTADQNYTVNVDFFAKWDIAASTTNWLLTNYPNVYLYGTLSEAAEYIKDITRADRWRARGDEMIGAVEQMTANNIAKNALLSTEVGMLLPRNRIDIARG